MGLKVLDAVNVNFRETTIDELRAMTTSSFKMACVNIRGNYEIVNISDWVFVDLSMRVFGFSEIRENTLYSLMDVTLPTIAEFLNGLALTVDDLKRINNVKGAAL